MRSSLALSPSFTSTAAGARRAQLVAEAVVSAYIHEIAATPRRPAS